MPGTMTNEQTTASDRAATGNQPGSDGPGITISEAARRLGLSTDAIRSRLHRGTLPGRKVDGNWQVFLEQPSAPTVAQPGSDRAATATDRADDGPLTSLLVAAKDDVIRRQDMEIAYLRDLVTERDRALEERSRELAAERERSDVLQQLALS